MHSAQAEHADEHSGNGPEDLTLACEQLTEAVSAHASQQQQLQQLLQQQYAAAPSSGQASAVTACTQEVGWAQKSSNKLPSLQSISLLDAASQRQSETAVFC